MRKFIHNRVTAAVLAGGLATVAGTVVFAQHAGRHPVQAAPAPMTAAVPSNSSSSTALEALSDAFATVASRVRPSVVYISARESLTEPATRRHSTMAPPAMPDLPPAFRQFLRDMPIMPDAPRGGAVASGSGFVVSADGYILTNAHVIDGADKVTVRLLDRREFPAKVIGRDVATDVAVVKIDADGLVPADLGNSDASRVGEWVLAVGNPLGEQLTFTVTQGIISAKGRGQLALPTASARSIQDFIQTDAAINPGNSGGPLVNIHGQVIGINAAIASPTGYNAGYGFAVPINLARTVMDQLIRNGRVERAALGITVRDVTPEDAAYAGLKSISGVLVQDYGSDNSAARRAGIQPGDIIVAVDGTPVEYVAQLQERIAFRKPGETVPVEVARKGGSHTTLTVKLQSAGEGISGIEGRTNAGSAGPGDASDGASAEMPLLGVTVMKADAEVAGVLVTDVRDSSPAAGRLEPGGDVILSVEGSAVGTPQELRSELTKFRTGDIVTLRVYNVRSKVRRVERVRLGASR